MSALRKKRPEYLWGGYKMDYLASRLCHLPGDQFKELFALVYYVGEDGCYPSQETLAKKMGCSQTKVRKLRDDLARLGEIGFIAGGGRAKSYYSIPGLPAHTAEQLAKKAPRVPESPVEGAPQARTEHLNNSINKEEPPADGAKKVVELAPAGGWHALVMRAPEDLRVLWLDKLQFHGVDADGRITLSTDNPFIAARVRAMLDEVAGLAGIARSVGVDPAKVVIRSRRHGADPLPPDLQVLRPTPAGMEEAAQRIEAASDTPPEPMPPVFSDNTVSLAAYRTRLQQPTDTASHSRQGDCLTRKLDNMAKTPYTPPQKDREIVWIGSSRKDISGFDPELKRAFGFQLRQVQDGEKPPNAKPAEVPGTMKLVEDYDTDTYRVIYTIKLKTAVYVLHAFQKKATSGIATPQKDIEIVRERMKRAAELDREREEGQGND